MGQVCLILVSGVLRSGSILHTGFFRPDTEPDVGGDAGHLVRQEERQNQDDRRETQSTEIRLENRELHLTTESRNLFNIREFRRFVIF